MIVMDLKQRSKAELLAEVIKLRKRIGKLDQKNGEDVQPEKAFQNPMELTRLMLEFANDAIYVTQDDFLKFVNSKFTKITGYTRDELMKTPAINFIHPEDRSVIVERYLMRMRGAEVPNLYPHRILCKQGDTRWIEVSSVIITWEGRPAQLSFMRDITERKAAEDALKQSEQLRADIINFLPDPTFAINGQGRITAWNRAMEELTDIPSQEMIGKSNYEHGLALYGERKPILVDKVVQPTAAISERYLSFKREKDFLMAETEITHRGKTVSFWCKAGLMRDDSGNVIGAIESLRDITSLKDMNATLGILLKRREKDIKESEEKFMLNIKELILPYLLKLKSAKLDMAHKVNIEIIEKHLAEIMSPFMSKLTSQYLKFSPRETQVVSLIRGGMTTKEIARALNISTNSVDVHRQNIRKKVGLNKKKANIRAFLISLEND